MVKYDDGTQLESSQKHIQHTTVKFAKRNRNKADYMSLRFEGSTCRSVY